MNRSLILILLFVAFVTGGCGGGNVGPTSSTVSGRVTYPDGLPVRGAVVTGPEGSTTTTTNGAFVLNGQRANDFMVEAAVTENSVTFRGQQLAQTSVSEQFGNVNIMVVPESEAASIEGYVTDRNGVPIQAATVSAFGSGALSSARVLTDRNGRYLLRHLIANEEYTVSASGGNYSSDTDTIVLDPGERARLDFRLGNPGSGVLPVPEELSIIAWTSPVTRDRQMAAALEAFKSQLSPKRRALASRLSPQGQPIEIEIEWTPSQLSDLFGYGIYRGRNGGAIAGYDFLKETLAGIYIDSDADLLAGATYAYQVTSLGSTYVPDSSDQSDRSDIVEATPLPDLNLQSIQFSPLTFRWNSVLGATSYVVFLFDEYPGYGVESIWSNSSNRSTGTSQVYNGNIILTSGKQYYYLVLAAANGDTSRSLSEIGSFTFRN